MRHQNLHQNPVRSASCARAFAATVLISVTCLFGTAAMAVDRDKQAQKQLDELKADISALERQINQAAAEENDVQAELRQIETEVAEAARASEQAQADLADLESRLAKLARQRATAELSVAADREALSQMLRSAYMTGRQPRMKMLLNQEDPSEVGRLLAYYDYYNADRAERIARVQESVAELSEIEQAIRDESAQLAGLSAEREQRMAELNARRSDRATVLANLRSNSENATRERQRLERDEKALNHLLSGVQALVKSNPLPAKKPPKPAAKPAKREPKPVKRPKLPAKPFGKLQGHLHWPVPGEIVNSYGSERAEGKLKWNGVLLAAAEGESVRAIAAGRVVFADYLSRMGLLVVIDHGDGYMSLYGHNQKLHAKVGDHILPGDRIASVGDSGGQTRSALYFEIRKGSKHYNPALWCKKKALTG